MRCINNSSSMRCRRAYFSMVDDGEKKGMVLKGSKRMPPL